MNGIESIAKAFARAKAEGRAALMPYISLGHPDAEASRACAVAIAAAGADMLELGLPFSDPLADGPVIQASTQRALENGVGTRECIEIARGLKDEGLGVPFLFMGYVNPILAYGALRFVRDAAGAGAAGLIIPDLPLEEAGDIMAACREEGIALVFLSPPNVSQERLEALARATRGFLYLVSVKGVTGARSLAEGSVEAQVARARVACGLPVAVGFGIADEATARRVGAVADGVIVGRAMVRRIGDAYAAGGATAAERGRAAASAAGTFARELAGALLSSQ